MAIELRGTSPPAADRKNKPASLALMTALILAILAGLPLAVWLDLRSLSEHSLRSQADELGSAINNFRNYYSSNVVGRVLGAAGPTKVVNNYHEIPGAIPIPATLSLELGGVVSAQDGSIRYRFFSDYPFANRAPHVFDRFEREGLARLRENPQQVISEVSGSIFDRSIRVATPIIMAGECVGCHNSHPESPKRDWKTGDVRGIQEIIIHRRLADNIFVFKYLLVYFVFAASLGLAFVALQSRQASLIRRINKKLEDSNEFLASVAANIAKYLSPQLYKSIFSGQKDVVIATERKKLTIFFSDIVDFTATTERLQAEELTALLNEYLTEMSAIAVRHGATVDKFIGDAMLVFFGDPESKGIAEDAEACLLMAIEMQQRLVALNALWRARGIEQPFRVRMGINTGFCNVGNFGSDDRMAYTIIGAEANLAARLQSIAQPGGIVLSYETYALVRDRVDAHPLPSITVKGIGRTIVPYAVDGLTRSTAPRSQVIAEHAPGLDLFLDVGGLDGAAVDRAVRVFEEAIVALEARRGAGSEA